MAQSAAMKLLLAALLSFALLHSASAAAQKPNVILFLVDDMGWMDSGVYGSKYYETPNMDRFATTAMRFTNAYSQPLCSPTRGSLLTGQYTARHGITTASGHQPPQAEGHTFLKVTASPNIEMLLPESRNYLEPRQITLAETLKGAGYRTAHIGKWHLGLTQPHWPEQQGFDVAFHCHPDPGPPGEYFSPYGVMPEGKPGGKTKVGTITDGPKGEYIVDRQADEAVKFIQGSKGGPFFLNLWCYGVHGPWGHKEEYTKAFAAKKDPTGRQGNPIMASMLKSVDECFGRILDELKKQGLLENTIIIFNSDNGGNVHSNITPEGRKSANEDWQKWAGLQPPTMNTPLRDGKGTLYEGGVRSPCVVRWKGRIKAGSTTGRVTGFEDWMTTLAELAGAKDKAPATTDGISFAPTLLGEKQPEREFLYREFPGYGGQQMLRMGDWKLVRTNLVPKAAKGKKAKAAAGPTEELFNIANDPAETKDVAKEHPDLIAKMKAVMATQHTNSADFPMAALDGQ